MTGRTRRSLLGRPYGPALNVVGGAAHAGPRLPTIWQVAEPELCYGLDYRYLTVRGSGPVRWPASHAVVLRIVDQPDAEHAVAEVGAELRTLTGLNIRPGPPLPANEADQPPPGVIAVRYADFGWIDQHTTSGASGTTEYLSGWAVVNRNLIGDVRDPGAVSILRHELAHALGLGDVERAGRLMSVRLADRPAGFTAADLHGLRELGTNTDIATDQD